MSSAPCDRHGGPSRGPLRSLYPALVRNGQRRGRKLKVCGDCLYELLSVHRKDWQDQALMDWDCEPPACSSCGQVAATTADLSRFYCTMYVEKDQRRDYCSALCSDCAELVTGEFKLHA